MIAAKEPGLHPSVEFTWCLERAFQKRALFYVNVTGSLTYCALHQAKCKCASRSWRLGFALHGAGCIASPA